MFLQTTIYNQCSALKELCDGRKYADSFDDFLILRCIGIPELYKHLIDYCKLLRMSDFSCGHTLAFCQAIDSLELKCGVFLAMWNNQKYSIANMVSLAEYLNVSQLQYLVDEMFNMGWYKAYNAVVPIIESNFVVMGNTTFKLVPLTQYSDACFNILASYSKSEYLDITTLLVKDIGKEICWYKGVDVSTKLASLILTSLSDSSSSSSESIKPSMAPSIFSEYNFYSILYNWAAKLDRDSMLKAVSFI